MKNNNLVFIGGGNLTRSIVLGLVASDYPKSQIYVADRNTDKREYFEMELGVNATYDVAEAINIADILVISIKPQSYHDFAENYADALKNKNKNKNKDNICMVISVMAGINIATLAKSFNLENDINIIRAMPNKPCMFQAGATGIYSQSKLSQIEKDVAEHIFRTLGIVVWVNSEEKINAIIAISGSSPAYFLYIMEIMQDVGLDMGLDADTVKALSLQSAFGASKMGLQSGENLASLREQITSKGGTTDRAIKYFQKNKLPDIIKGAMQAAFDRGVEMEQDNNK